LRAVNIREAGGRIFIRLMSPSCLFLAGYNHEFLSEDGTGGTGGTKKMKIRLYGTDKNSSPIEVTTSVK